MELHGALLISSMVGSVAQPMFNQVGSDQTRQQRVFRKMLRFTAFMLFLPCWDYRSSLQN